MVTMGEFSTLQRVGIKMVSSSNVNLVGVHFSGTTTVTSELVLCNILIEAGSTTAYSYGFWADGTCSDYTLDKPMAAIKHCIVSVTSTSSGAVRGGILTGTSGNQLSVRNSVVHARGAGGNVGSFESTNTSSFVVLKNSSFSGVLFDIKQPNLGNTDPSVIQLNATDLDNALSINGFTVNTEPTHQWHILASRQSFTGGGGEVGTTVGTYYMHIGSQISNFSTSLHSYPFVQPVIVFEGILSATKALPVASTVTVNLYKSDSPTLLGNGTNNGTPFAVLVITSAVPLFKFQNKVGRFNPTTEFLQVQAEVSGATLTAGTDVTLGLGLY
jgi:hypothetical protein